MKKILFFFLLHLFLFVPFSHTPVFSQTTCPQVSSATGSVLLHFNITTSGQYAFWSRLKTDSNLNNSYYLQVDNQCAINVGDGSLSSTEYTWINFKDGNPASKILLSLTTGSHTLKLIGKDPGVIVDNVLITSDLKCTPTGLGGNCQQITTTPTVYTTPTPTRTPTPTPAIIPTSTLAPTPTPVVNGITFNLELKLQGIGKGGDNANPVSIGNMNPIHPQRNITIQLFDANGKKISEGSGTANFIWDNGSFFGRISLVQRPPVGNYLAVISSPQFLNRRYQKIISLTQNQNDVYLDTVTLIGSDANNDNSVNILDYNVIASCYSDLLPPIDCDNLRKLQADITDDGIVNQFDYNFFMRNAGNYRGE